MITKYLAAYIRKNIDGKKDYIAIEKYADGSPFLFNSNDDAFATAEFRCTHESQAYYSPTTIKISI